MNFTRKKDKINVTYKVDNLSAVDDVTRTRLSNLTLRQHGSMYDPAIRKLDKPIVVAYDDQKNPVGWSMVMDVREVSKERFAAYVGVYVALRYRKQGIGRELLNRMREHLKGKYDFMTVVPHNVDSYKFFKSVKTRPWRSAPKDDYGGAIYNRRVVALEGTRKIEQGVIKTDGINGFINNNLDVIGSETAGTHQVLIGWAGRGDFSIGDKKWRYYKDDHIVKWWEQPSDKEKEIVDNFLKQYYNVNGIGGHSMYVIDPRKPEATNENELLMELKQLIIEGAKEKALEDFVSKTIKGTEWEGKVFIAGGYVRDEFMGKDPKDLDLLVNAPNGGIEFAKWITKKVGAYKGGATEEDTGSNPVIFPRFGTAKFNLRGVVHNGIDLSDMDVESVMPRKEQYTAGSRKPTVTGGELKDDVERRDFTVNSLLKDLSTGEILDLTGMGKEDIKAGIVRTPLNPDKIFTDDPLRMLRAIRFAVKYNWKLPMFMIRGLKKNAAQLTNISQERIRDELDKMLMTNFPSKAIKLMKVAGLLPYVIPELLPAIKMTQNKHHKHDVFGHTLDVLSKTQPVLLQRLMGLFHDIGKTVTRTVEPETQGVHFYGHEAAGERIVGDVMARLKYPKELIDAVKLGVKSHMRLKQAGDTGVKIKDTTLLRFRNEMGEQLENILNVIHADNISHSEASSMPNQIDAIRDRLTKLKEIPNKPRLPISGKDLQELGLKPGPIFSTIIKAVTDAWYENPGLSKEQGLEIAKRIASSHD